MKLTRETKFGAWALAAVLIAAASFFIGAGLKPAEDPYYIFDTDAAAYANTSTIAARSPGGFTGFGELDGTASRTVLSGRVVEMSESSITLESPGGLRTSLRFGDDPTINRLEPANASILQPGVNVAVRLDAGGDTAEAVLVVSQP